MIKPGGGIYHKTSAQGFPAQKHPILHGVPIGQGELNFKSMIAQSNGGLDHKTFLGYSRRALYDPTIDQFGAALYVYAPIILQGIHLEPYPFMGPLCINFNIIAMYISCFRPRITPGLTLRSFQF